MKTIADFKRRIVSGAMVHGIRYTYPNGLDAEPVSNDLGTRPVSIVQTNSFAFKTTRSDNGKVVDSWCSCPKKDFAIFYPDDPNKITILEEMRGTVKPILTYKFI